MPFSSGLGCTVQDQAPRASERIRAKGGIVKALTKRHSALTTQLGPLRKTRLQPACYTQPLDPSAHFWSGVSSPASIRGRLMT